MKKLLKRILCFSLSLIIALSSFVISAYAENTLDGAVPGSINLYVSDRGTIKDLRAMQLNNTIYVDAIELANLLECRFIKTDNYFFFGFGRTYYNFYYSSKKVGVVYTAWVNNVGETSFESIAETIKDDEHNAVWVPLMFTLAVLNCDFIIGNDCINISIPKSTIFDLQYDWIKNRKRYSFDWNDDYYLNDVNVDTMRKSAYVVQLINGMISMDASSIVESVSCLNRDISGYDIKYGQDFSRLYIIPSADELDSINSIISNAAKPYSNTAKVVKNINGTVNELSQNTANSAKLCQDYINGINNANGNIAEFNKNFAQMKKNADKEAKWLKNTELLNEIDKAIDFEGISAAVSATADVISVMTYVSEYLYNDKFAIDSMEWFLDNDYSKEYLSRATLNSCSTYIKTLDTNVATYSAYRYFCDNIGSILGDSVKALGVKGVSSAIGANANWTLFAWSIAKNTIPFFKDGLSNTEKMLLTTYAQCFQYEAIRYVNEISDKVFVNNTVNEDYLKDYVMSWYSFFKSAYICRDAALGVNYDIPQFRIDDQIQKNKEIASNLSFLKQSTIENDKPEKYVGTIFGFIPSVKNAFIKDYNETPVINIFTPVKEEYDITNYMTINNEGTDGNITVSYEWDVDAVNDFKELLKQTHWLTDDECNKFFKSIEIEITPNANLSEDDEITIICKYNTDFNKKGVYFIENLNLKVNGSKNHDMFFEYLKNHNDGSKISPCVTAPNRVPSGFFLDYFKDEEGIIGTNFYDYDGDHCDEMVTISFFVEDDNFIPTFTFEYYDYNNAEVVQKDSFVVQSSQSKNILYAIKNVDNESYLNYYNWFYSYENQLGVINECDLYLGGEFTSVQYVSVENEKFVLSNGFNYFYISPVGDTFDGVYYLEDFVNNKIYYNSFEKMNNNGYQTYLNETENLFLHPNLRVGEKTSNLGERGCKRNSDVPCICYFQQAGSLFNNKEKVIGTVLYPVYHIDYSVESELYDYDWKDYISNVVHNQEYYDNKETIQ